MSPENQSNDRLAPVVGLEEPRGAIHRSRFELRRIYSAFGNDGRWKKVKVSIDRAVFCTQLNKVREIRNDVMHFDPDGILPADLERLRDFAHFLQRLQTIGVP